VLQSKLVRWDGSKLRPSRLDQLSAVGAQILVAREGHAAASQSVAARSRGPAEAMGRRFHHGAGTLVFHMRKAHRQRVYARGLRQLIEHTLDREYVQVGSQRPKCRYAQ
jgi:hypothetical protein